MSLIPFEERDGVLWLDGCLVPWRHAKISVLSHGLHYASSVFEGERVYGGCIFKLREHTARLIRSAGILGFEIPWAQAAIEEASDAVVRAMGIAEGYVRPIAWRGGEQMPTVAAHGTKIHLAIAAWEWPTYFSGAAQERGVRMMIAPWARPAPHTAPAAAKCTGGYAICTLSKHAAEAQGYDDALMLDWRGGIAEATGANIFFVIDGALHTPVPDCFLDGITRRSVIELARARGIAVVERAIALDELARAQEVFLTGTAAEITPVREIDGHAFALGPVCRSLREDFARLVRKPVPARAA